MNSSIAEQLFFFIAGAFAAVEVVGVTIRNLTAAITGASGFGVCVVIGVTVVVRYYLRRQPSGGEPR